MGKHTKEEDKSYALHFLAGSVVLILTTVWAVWSETVSLRPWKRLQSEYLALEQDKLARELRETRTLVGRDGTPHSGGIVPSASAGGPGTAPSGDLERAKSRLQELERSLNESRHTPISIQQVFLPELGVVDRCKSCHVGIDKEDLVAPQQPFTPHPGQFLFLDHHPPDRMGCTVCHAGQGRATSSVSKAHGRVEHWEKPLLDHENISASCLKCHGQNVESLRGASNLAAGVEVFRRYACYGCHFVAGYESLPRPGPPLRNVGEKINYSYLVKWIKSPRSIVADARMPDFGFTDEQAHNVADFLFSFTRRERSDARAVPSDPKTVARGKELFNTSRCSICHRVEGRGGINQKVYAPDLSLEGSKIQSAEWIADRIGDPSKFVPDTVMPRFRFTGEERKQIAAYVSSEFLDGEMEEAKLRAAQPIARASIEKGKELVQKFGCFGCHEIPGFEKEGKIGADLTRIGAKPLERFDFTGLKIEHDRAAWLRTKVKTPRVFVGDLRMPDYHLTDQQAQGLTTFLVGLTGAEIPPEYMPAASTADFVPAGETGKLIQDLKCLICHSIRGRGGKFAPDLSFEGSAVERAWLKKFLKSPDLIRPLLEQMPKFNLSDQEAEILADYIKMTLTDPRIPEAGSAADSGAIARGSALYDRSGCRACHQRGASGGAVGPNLTSVGERLTAGYLQARSRNAQSFRPGIVEPHYGFTEEQIAALAAFLKSQGQKNYVAKK